MTVWLALDTSTSAVTVAVRDESRVLASAATIDARRHAEVLAPTIDEVVSSAGVRRRDIAAIAVGVGPGPFTGLRAGIVTAATLSEVLGVPAYGICSLDAIAQQVCSAQDAPESFVVATDARRKEVYWARYDVVSGAFVRHGDPAVAKADSLGLAEVPVAGRGALLYPSAFGADLGVLDVDAAQLAAVAIERPDLRLGLQPLYLRQPDAVPQAAVKSVLP